MNVKQLNTLFNPRSIVVGDPWQRQGLGTIMTRYILEIAWDRGIKKVYAYVLEDNTAMLDLFKKFNFSCRWQEECWRVEMLLQEIQR